MIIQLELSGMDGRTDGWTDRRTERQMERVSKPQVWWEERERAVDRNMEGGVSGTRRIPCGIGQQGPVAYGDSDVCGLQGQGL